VSFSDAPGVAWGVVNIVPLPVVSWLGDTSAGRYDARETLLQ